MNYTDEQLVAFLHGTLAEADLAAVEAAINADPALADRAALLADKLLPEQDAAVRDAFAPVITAGVPDRFRAQIAAGPPAAEVIDFAAAQSRRPKPSWGWPQLGAMAASLALGLFAGTTFLGEGTGGGPDAGAGEGFMLASASGVQITGGLSDALSTARSGQAVQVDKLGGVEVAITFRDFDDRVCRQFSLQGVGATEDVLACREGGNWQLEAFGRRADSSAGMRTASGESATAVITAVDALIAGDPLVGEDESAALR